MSVRELFIIAIAKKLPFLDKEMPGSSFEMGGGIRCGFRRGK